MVNQPTREGPWEISKSGRAKNKNSTKLTVLKRSSEYRRTTSFASYRGEAQALRAICNNPVHFTKQSVFIFAGARFPRKQEVKFAKTNTRMQLRVFERILGAKPHSTLIHIKVTIISNIAHSSSKDKWCLATVQPLIAIRLVRKPKLCWIRNRLQIKSTKAMWMRIFI